MDPAAFRLHYAVEPPDVTHGMRLAAIRFAVRDMAAARAVLAANAAARMDKLLEFARPPSLSLVPGEDDRLAIERLRLRNASAPRPSSPT